MIIPPTNVEQSAPGIDLSNLPEGLSIQMSDPVRNLEHAGNAVPLTFDLSGFEHVRLSFKALEYGNEPHAPPSGPFGDDASLDGAAANADGVNWYEIRDLRSLTERQGQLSANSSFSTILSNNCRPNTPLLTHHLYGFIKSTSSSGH